MLLLDAEIYFYKPEEKASALSNDLDPSLILRPTIDLGNGMLWSGQLVFDKSENDIFRGKHYHALIQLFTINDEEFECLKFLVKKNAIFTIHSGSKLIGTGKVLDYLYEPDEQFFKNWF